MSIVLLINSDKFNAKGINKLVEASGKNRDVIIAAICSGKFNAKEITEFVKKSGGDENVIKVAMKALNIT